MSYETIAIIYVAGVAFMAVLSGIAIPRGPSPTVSAISDFLWPITVPYSILFRIGQVIGRWG